MPKIHLTDISIRALTPPSKGQITYWDDTTPGFGVRVSQGGAKSFVLVSGANRQRTTIGRYPTIKLSDARTEAKRVIAEHTLGKTRYSAISFEQARDRFLSDCERRNKPRTVQDYTRLLNRHFRFSKTPISEISTQELMRRINRLNDTPSEQNHAFIAARVFFRWAARNRLIERSPLEDMSLPAASRSRERVFTEAELSEVYRTARAHPYPYGAIISLLLLTGQRRGEIASLKWGWIDAEAQTITLPSTITKNKRAHTFPYGHTAASVLEEIPELGEYIFPATRSHVRGKATTIFNGWPKAKVFFDKELENVEPYTLHDLRRTFSSTLAALGTPIHVTEKLLNHVSGSLSGVAAIYNRHTYMDEMRQAIHTYENHLISLCS